MIGYIAFIEAAIHITHKEHRYHKDRQHTHSSIIQTRQDSTWTTHRDIKYIKHRHENKTYINDDDLEAINQAKIEYKIIVLVRGELLVGGR